MSVQPQDHTFEVVTSPHVDPAHQALRREVNECITSINHDLGIEEEDVVRVLCECVHPDCSGLIEMTVSQYEAVRRFPTRFFIKERHEVANDERVVAEVDGYVVIEASGRGGLYAVSADPRSPYRRGKGMGA
jgi:hypothetical protein